MTLSVTTTNRIVWAVRIFVAIAFVAAATAKIAGFAPMVAVFEQIGIGQWFRYLTACIELVGALLLLIPTTGFFGALLLGSTMTCAVITHLLVIGGSPAPAILLGGLCWFIAFRLRTNTTAIKTSDKRTAPNRRI
ncbi:DoxX family protein [Pseudomonas sp. NPDC087342]|uniref:DoxX family protein n=1 Tax=Pseudomonas sp. NPDC087342 TaxID=3364437 RepID=UPI003829F408